MPLCAAVSSGIAKSWRNRAGRAVSITFEPGVLARFLAITVRRSIGRSTPIVTADLGLGLTGNTDELAEVLDERDEKLAADERHFLNLRGPLSCCTAAPAEIGTKSSLL